MYVCLIDLTAKYKLYNYIQINVVSGSMGAAVELVKKMEGAVTLCLVVIELSDLQGRKKVSYPVHSLVQY